MKRLKVFLVSVLAVLTMLLGFVGCGAKGVYRLESYEVAGFTKTVEDSASYIELKSKDEVYVSIAIGDYITLEGDGTWTELEEDNKYQLEVKGVKYNVTIIDGEMIVDFLVVKAVLEKD
ncbi:MAG: hypothetical protein IJ514_07310 [Clostridia bacterium]|nr:hypothetical protein [Clostridia bacterium]